MRSVCYYKYDLMIISYCMIFFWNSKGSNLVLLKNNDIVILKIFFSHLRSYIFLKILNRGDKNHLVFMNLKINEINISVRRFTHLFKVDTF